MNINKIFILGVGAQKSDTGCLHQYISKSPYYNMGRMKEYHIWDALSISDCSAPVTITNEDLFHFFIFSYFHIFIFSYFHIFFKRKVNQNLVDKFYIY
jgi:hypothetical protein